MNVLFLDETVWHKLWPQNKYRSTWPIFHGLVILLNIFKIIWWVNIIVGILEQCDTKIDLIKICRSVNYILWSSDFASYLDYLMEKYCTWDNGSMWHKDGPLKTYVGQWPIFHGPLILPFYHCHRLKLFVYIIKWRRPGVFVPLQALALVIIWVEKPTPYFFTAHPYIPLYRQSPTPSPQVRIIHTL